MRKLEEEEEEEDGVCVCVDPRECVVTLGNSAHL